MRHQYIITLTVHITRIQVSFGFHNYDSWNYQKYQISYVHGYQQTHEVKLAIVILVRGRFVWLGKISRIFDNLATHHGKVLHGHLVKSLQCSTEG